MNITSVYVSEAQGSECIAGERDKMDGQLIGFGYEASPSQ